MRYVCELGDPDLFYHATVPLNFGGTFIRNNAAILEQAKTRYAQLDYPPLVKLCDAFLKLDITDQLRKIKTPTCVIGGEKDIIKPVYPYSRVIHDGLSDSEMVIVRDSGHSVTFEKPEEFNSIVLGFLHKQSRRNAS